MNSSQIVTLRTRLGLSQGELATVLNVHPMTVSKWERGVALPDAYQQTLLGAFARTAAIKGAQGDQLKQLILGAGVVAALLWLLSSASSK